MECSTENETWWKLSGKLLMRHLFEYHDFTNLSHEARENAIENVRSAKYSGEYGADDISSHVVDDDSLFEPPHEEMKDLFGDDYYESNGNRFMIENSRNQIYFISKEDPNYYIHCKMSLDVTNDNLFLRWLGIPSAFRKYTYYTFIDPGRASNTTIELEIDDEESMIEEFGSDSVQVLNTHFEKATRKFDTHIDNVLSGITSSIEDEFSDDSILDDIENFDIKFEEDGSISE